MNIRHLSAWAAALALAMVSAAPLAHAEDKAPVNLRAVGGANLGGTWNVGLAGLGKLVNDRYPGSTFNVLQGASTSNPLRLDSNSGDITVTQGFNTFAAKTGMAPYKKPLTNIASLANINDISRFQIIVSRDLPVNSFDELVEKKFEGSIPAFVAAFGRRQKLSQEDIQQMQQLIDRYRKEGDSNE